MKSEILLDGRVTLYCGDIFDGLKDLPDSSIDSVCTDPPYHLTSTVKRFGSETAAPAQFGTDGAYARASAGFMGQQWDGGDIAFKPETWREVLRVLKPGGHIAAFGSSRGYHRMACAIEDAGFEVRDSLMWVYGTGFPKSHDVSKGIDKAAGAEREVIGRRPDWVASEKWREAEGRSDRLPDSALNITAPATEAAREWEGWGTALKPAFEPIVLARKPLSESTVAANVLRWRTGALNIDATRVPGKPVKIGMSLAHRNNNYGRGEGGRGTTEEYVNDKGRWPANVILDGSDEVVGAFPQSKSTPFRENDPGVALHDGGIKKRTAGGFSDEGSAARFFFSSKADADDRLGSGHPTVKPVDLMQWLCRLITPPGGTVLDCFAGTGTTAEAAVREGFRAIVIEREAKYQKDIRRRLALTRSGRGERKRESVKAKSEGQPADHGPLFGGTDT